MRHLEVYRQEVEDVCSSFPVKRLGLFGSVLNEKFNAESDIDVLVVFDKDNDIDFFKTYFELKEKLEGVFQRSVDLVIEKNFRNPYFRESVEKTRTIIYER